MKRIRVMVLVAVLAGSLFLANSVRAFVGGEMIWEQTFSFPTGYDTILVGGVAASTTTLIVCGTAFNSAIDTGDIGFIKAFDQAFPGNLKWEKSLTEANGGGHNRNSFNGLAVVGNTVVVEGYSSSYTQDPNPPYNYTYTLNQTTLWAYNADTGALLWGPINRNAAPITNGPTTMVTANNKVFVVRQQNHHKNPPADTGDCIVQAYQVATPNLSPMALLLE